MQEPRQLYGLGSLVKSIGKTVKKVVKSDLGKAALLAAVGFGIPGTQFGGLIGRGAGSMFGAAPSIFGKTGGISALLGQKAMTTAPFAKATGMQKILGAIPGGGYTVGAIGSILAASGMGPEEIEATKRNPEKLKIYLRDYYSKTNPDASDEEVDTFVETNVSEYAVGGRVGLEAGANKDFQEYLKGREEFNKKQNAEQLYKEYLENKRRQKVAVEKTMAANGGLMPTGVMRANKAGTIERDYRETGGFVPVGIKEKADDVPAMLSKNEFVMTADAVRGMGGGNIEKGAQRLYDQMKTMEKRVV